MPIRYAGPRRSRSDAARTRAGGFSLLEVLVAFVILSLVATAVFRLFSGALGNASAADDYSRAVLVTESVLRSIVPLPPPLESCLCLLKGLARALRDCDGVVLWGEFPLYRVEPPPQLGSHCCSDLPKHTLMTLRFPPW